MKLSKAQTSAARQCYDLFWSSYLNHDYKRISPILDDTYWLADENRDATFFNKNQFVRRCKGLNGSACEKMRMRNRKLKTRAIASQVVIHETADIQVQVGSAWKPKGSIRLTTALQRKRNRWVIVYQQGSLPGASADTRDARSGDGSNDLSPADKTLTLQLRRKERELEIETAVEAVRCRAIAMRKSEELKAVVHELRTQMGLLGQPDLDTCVIHLYEESPDFVHAWAAMKLPNSKAGIKDFAARVPKKGLAIIEESLRKYRSRVTDYVLINEGAKIEQWIRFMEQNYPGTVRIIKSQKARSITATSYWAYADFDGGSLLMVTSERPDRDSRAILRKFADAFGLAYRRFVDLNQAERQAREAQIEAALERVRSRSMAMHKSDELREVLQLILEQLQQLNFNIDSAQFNLNYKESDDLHVWTAVPGQLYPVLQYVPYFENDIMSSVKVAKAEGLDFLSHVATFREKNKFFRHFFKHVGGVPDSRRKYIIARRGYARSIVFLDSIFLGIQNYDGTPYSEVENSILRRFGKVFEQSYTRFLDLQRAEAQAREAQIEAGLERVRGKTMAMHNSQDVGTTVAGLFDELITLGLEKSARCGIGILDGSDTMELWTASTNDKGLVDLAIGHLNMTLHPLLIGVKETWSTKKESFSYELQGEDLLNYFNILNDYPDYTIQVDVKALPERIIHNSFYFTDGVIFCFTPHPISADFAKIFKRFAGVFGQTYKRYLDLRKAELQAREAEVQLALERVRARAMAMQKSQELSEVAELLFKQVNGLGIRTWTTGFNIWSDDNNSYEDWITNPQGGFLDPYTVVATEHIFKAVSDARKRGDEFFVQYEDGETLKETYRMLSGFAKQQFDGILASGFEFPEKQYEHFVFCSSVSLMFITYQPVPEAHEIFRRFGKVFEQTYTRFLDLQKAEAQAREAQVEAALEKVRSRTMAMQRSDELAEISFLLDGQVRGLGIKTRGCAFNIYGETESTEWFSNEFGTLPTYKTPREGVFLRYYEAGQQGEKLYIEEFGGKKLIDHYDYLCSLPIVGEELTKFKDSGNELPTFQIDHVAYFKFGYLLFITLEPAFEAHDIFKRFAKVFEQTYTRYLDLQKAEEQAREVRIEAALERIRASAMAMHSSDGILEVTQVLREQIALLGEKELESILIHIYHEDTDQFEAWYSYRHPDNTDKEVRNGKQMLSWSKTARARKDKENYYQSQSDFTIAADYEMLKEWYEYLLTIIPEVVEVDTDGQPRVPDILYYNYSKIAGGTLLLITNQEASDHAKYLLKRAAAVFNLAYSRFLDLQKAEAQAREAQIEAALERVRSKAMGMHNSQDLTDTIGVFYDELQSFSLTPRRCGVGLLNKENKTGDIFTWNTTENGERLELVGTLKMEGHPVLEQVYETWLTQTEYHPVLRGNEIKEYYNVIRPQIAFPDYEHDAIQYGYFFYFKEGGVYAWTQKEMLESELEIYRRFATVLSLTYKRYKDLQQAEASAKEAIKQAALDRIRADIASMRAVSDLDRITPVIWKELTVLGMPFVRCGVFIMDEAQQLVHTFLSTPEGKAIAAFHLRYDTSSANLRTAIDCWHRKEKYIDHWDEEGFKQFADVLKKEGALPTAEVYLETIPHGGFYLHFLPFLQGMLYVGNSSPLKDEQIEVIQSVADAFSTAYSRYEDFKKLEIAKQQVDKTLTELKQAQSQLIQSEKMASLGELTAGIAHEIKNPLNFVNNFSEVSNELIEEMNAEIANGNTEAVLLLASDVKANLEKIIHHGKRADDIVKSMLQHSRNGSGQKEATDINELCDEYLRLAYHGLRAKDKSFNASLKTAFDENVGKINVIPQDIGRVVLNLITNAFYAVSQKESKERSDYEPTVAVATIRMNGLVEIRVKDNGCGMTQAVKEKIFQPFFTTKPTGQGTGLGLSLAYDIITKGHGGTIDVISEDGKGTEFIIHLPSA